MDSEHGDLVTDAVHTTGRDHDALDVASGRSTGDSLNELLNNELLNDELLDDELLIEEISIDGMCGVY